MIMLLLSCANLVRRLLVLLLKRFGRIERLCKFASKADCFRLQLRDEISIRELDGAEFFACGDNFRTEVIDGLLL